MGTYGFIGNPPELAEKLTKKDVFMNKTDAEKYKVGDRLSFTIKLHRDGRPQAQEIELISEATNTPVLPPLSAALPKSAAVAGVGALFAAADANKAAPTGDGGAEQSPEQAGSADATPADNSGGPLSHGQVLQAD